MFVTMLTCESYIHILVIFTIKINRFADHDMFVWFTGGGIGHQNTALATRNFCEALLQLFRLNFDDDASNDQDTNGPNGGDNPEDGSDAPEDEEESEDDIDDDVESTNFEDDRGEHGADEEDELGFGSF